MAQGYSMLGFVVIVVLYAVIGLLAAAGTISIVIAAFHLAFAGYFGVATSLGGWKRLSSRLLS
jgi:hypothetical protein